MNSVVPAPIATLPWRVIFILTALVGFGATVLYSAAGGHLEPWAGKHVARFLVLLAMAIVMSRLRMEFWKSITFPLYLALIFLLIVVEFLGFVGGGSQRWINLGIITLQPSELMKPVMVLAAAWFFDRLPPNRINGIDAIWPIAALLVIPSALVVIQPDFDAAIAYAFGLGVVAFLAGLPLIYFIGAAAAVAILAPLVYFFGMKPYQQDRVLIFLNPENDPLGAGYHITQSKIAIGSGGIFGKGFGNGTQSHLDYLPEGHTDFVFATMAEEWGIVGGFFILGLYVLLMRWGLTVAMESKTRYGQLVASGLTCTIFFYIMINLLMVVGLAPVAGIPLPFVSHGGSSMLTMMICVGIIMSIERHPGAKRGQFS
ncbi:rod shape-determining protein RodA [Sphingorhabdus contaminans]|jgi:rod shape determining protein RodA|uniref:Peptidoglycan glycosyltransferase MrdB n=1 Tax=Sphingorhabdus contaminans TaxID=1343899 RepID=A0A553WH63_9SPHN|nr:rod shape-determining protein RodA [Sphingorhabdus contaminans]TSB03984.1 rod shape-determining protein RodA [Sphingorhabdus contaminans]